MTGLSRSPKFFKGAIVKFDLPLNPVPAVIPFQFNPESLSRTVEARTAEGQGGTETFRLAGAPTETIKVEAVFDAADDLEKSDPVATQHGLHPQLAQLETLLYPKSATVIANTALMFAGAVEVLPARSPFTVFIRGKKRILPVRISSLSITEEAYDINLNPIRAKVSMDLAVLTLGRVVSLRDYEDFARGFAAISKARADWTFDGFQRPIFVTIAGQEGVLLPEEGEDMVNLLSELREAGEADIRVSVRNYQPASFVVEARLFPDSAYRSEDVKAAAEAALADAFSFEARDLGQPVSRGQVIAVLQAVAGVEGVDLDYFHRSGSPRTLEVRLGSAAAAPSLDGTVPTPAELLTVDMAASKLEVVT